MLKDGLFKFLSVNHTEGLVIAAIEINPDHEIFNGHFPGQPVLPGASMVQLVKDVLERALKAPVRLQIANNLKFLSLIDPQENKRLQLTLNYTVDTIQIKVNGDLIGEDDTICFKFQGVFVLINS